jgi:hypothetical protein
MGYWIFKDSSNGAYPKRNEVSANEIDVHFGLSDPVFEVVG